MYIFIHIYIIYAYTKLNSSWSNTLNFLIILSATFSMEMNPLKSIHSLKIHSTYLIN